MKLLIRLCKIVEFPASNSFRKCSTELCTFFLNRASKVYRSARYVFIHCLWQKIEFYVNLKPWKNDPAIHIANLETLAKLDTF